MPRAARSRSASWPGASARPRSTAYELVNRFVEAGILESYDEEGRVFFGRTVHFWAADYLTVNDLTKRAWEEVQRLAQAVGRDDPVLYAPGQ
jgi:DNA-binding IclR family transcriptional regulator